MAINYEEEAKKLEAFEPGDSSMYWKPVPGKHKVNAMSELEDAEPFIEEGKEPNPQVKIKLKVGDEEKTWTMGKGKSPASSYGQLVALAKENNNSLVGKQFTIVVISDGNKNKYTIV